MPTIYRRKPGSRRYIDYTNEQLQQCLSDVRSKTLTQREASIKYNIPRSTIKNKLKNKHRNKPGHPTVFTTEEEQAFVAHTTALSEYGFPITEIDLKIIIQNYLSSRGRQIKQFKNNVPGTEWVRGFLNRNKTLSRRLANNIKKARAAISEQIITDFIENLKEELKGIPPENIYNYDESNLTDDPGKKRVICRRGVKYPETVVNATKVSFSVMFCGNASGETIPPYVIYKAEHLWSTWTDNGPNGAGYNRSKSGWMDSITFEDWFMSHLLPILKKKEGRKVVIGDNLSSHINKNVLEACQTNNISFICLPANATHILQPLDVAYFRPLKVKWRQALLQWKNSQQGRRLPTLPKDQFPTILKTALDNMKDSQFNLLNGFRKTGIYPQNVTEPLSRLPNQDRIVDLNMISESFMRNLTQTRSNITPTQKIKKKKLDVPAGRSIRAEDTILDREQAGPSGMSQVKPKKKERKIRKQVVRKSSSTESSDAEISLDSFTEDLITAQDQSDNSEDYLPLTRLTTRDLRNSYDHNPEQDEPLAQVSKTNSLDYNAINEDEDKENLPLPKKMKTCNDEDKVVDNISLQKVVQANAQSQNVGEEAVVKEKRLDGNENYCVGDHVLVKWESHVYPGKIISMSEEGALVSCMKRGKFWKWPAIIDEQLYRWEEVIKKINVPKFVKKGLFTVPEIDNI